jgi:hypothetical protein
MIGSARKALVVRAWEKAERKVKEIRGDTPFVL